MALIHGGQLQLVAKQFNIAPENWLDLSTGIAPLNYPLPEIPEESFKALPQSSNGLETAAKHYYGANSLLVTNGSQAIIKLLPTLWREQNPHSTIVYLPEQGYKEHALAWQTAGFTPCWYQDELPELTKIADNSVLVIINPNNPTGQLFTQSLLISYQEKLAKCAGLLVIDEAFIDVIKPSQSMTNTVNNYENTLVLRSFGKFFGLAGIRIGFLIAGNNWCTKFKELLGPWQVNGPAQIIAEQALSDRAWHSEQCHKLNALRVQQEALLWKVFSDKLINTIQGCDLFLTLSFHQNDNAQKLYYLLCQQGIYCRLSDEQDTLRFGISLKENFEHLARGCAHAYKEL